MLTMKTVTLTISNDPSKDGLSETVAVLRQNIESSSQEHREREGDSPGIHL